MGGTESRTELVLRRQFGAETIDAAVERAAEALRGRQGIPVDPYSIARGKGYRVKLAFTAKGCPEGRLTPSGHSFVIELGQESSPNRRRFSLGHELGHTFFYERGPTGLVRRLRVLSRTEYEAEERICDRIAMATLMPREQVCEAFLSRSLASPSAVLSAVENTARELEVSSEALTLRLSQLIPEAANATVLFLRFRENPRKHTDAELRLEGSYKFGTMRRLFIANNSSARRSLKLNSADELFGEWRKNYPILERGGRFILDSNVLVCTRGTVPEYDEEMAVSELSEYRYRRSILPVRTASCLYVRTGHGERDAYVLSIVTPRGI